MNVNDELHMSKCAIHNRAHSNTIFHNAMLCISSVKNELEVIFIS